MPRSSRCANARSPARTTSIGALSMFAVKQGDSTKRFDLQPCVDEPTDPEMTKLFAIAAQGQPAVTWAGMSLEVDPENGLFYGVETLAREVAA